MRRASLVTLLGSLVLGSVLLNHSVLSVESIMARLGIDDDSAQNYILYSLRDRTLSYPNIPQLKQIEKSERAAMVTLVGSFARAYTESKGHKGTEVYRQGAKGLPRRRRGTKD
jgi:hypothetical protein